MLRTKRIAAFIVLALAAGVLTAPTARTDQAGGRLRGRTAAGQQGKIDAGLAHTCAIDTAGDLRCWGDNGSGQLGYGHINNIGDNEHPGAAGPVDLGAGRKAIAVGAGNAHTCALLDDGTVRCWGVGSSGRLGYNNTTTIGDTELPSAAGPVNIGAGRTAVAIAIGASHSCALLDDGTVRCWGLGLLGRLGYGNTVNIGDNEHPGDVGPVELGAGRTAVSLAAGETHTCAALDDGTVRCWGEGTNGRLGYGNTTTISDPDSVPALDFAPNNVTAVTAGGAHTCAFVNNAIGTTCWGKNDKGQLGRGSTDDIGDNEAVTFEAVGSRTSAGASHTCTLGVTGVIKCWGDGASGRLGYATTATLGDNEHASTVGFIDVGSGNRVLAVTAGGSHSCALLDEAQIRCWGANDAGQLGYANMADIGDDEHPSAVGPVNRSYVAGRKALQVAAGNAHTCVVRDDETLRCWGDGANGRLGYGNTTTIGDNEHPGSVGPVDLGAGRTAIDLAAGTQHTCALLEDQTVRCWGSAASGHLGYGNLTSIGDDEAPSAAGPVVLNTSVVEISAGPEHTCALNGNGFVKCWGEASDLRLGTSNPLNDIGDQSTDTIEFVDSQKRAITLSAGSISNCIITIDADVQCWGDLSWMDGPETHLPVTIDVGGAPLAIAAGTSHACVILDDGTVRCWGVNFDGQLGYPGVTELDDPSTAPAVDVGGSAIAIAAGWNHTCATLVDGTVRCWGEMGPGVDPNNGYSGTATIGDNEAPSSVGPIQLGSTAGMLTAGDGHTCAVQSDGEVRCWGEGANGRLGYANTNDIGDNEHPNTAGPVDIVDDPPTALADSASTSEDTQTVVDVDANDTDADGGPLTVQNVTGQPANGVAVLNGDGTISYTPNANYCNSPPATTLDTFTYALNGGSVGSVSVTVGCVDDAPSAVNDSATVPRDAPATAVDVLANDTDIDGGAKTVSSADDPTNGTVVITGGGSGLTYQPDASYCNSQAGGGADAFTYALNGGSTATVSVTVTCPSIARALTISYKATKRRFSGTLFAPGMPACASGRTVTIFRAVSGPDVPLVTATTATSGTYSVKKRARRGTYYAAIAAESITGVADCQAAVSPNKRVR